MSSTLLKKPRIFIGSSFEGLEIARAIQEQLYHDAEPILWTEDIFSLSESYLESLSKNVSTFDFGIFVLRSDDSLISRGKKSGITRGNVLFEMGLFNGSLGRDRTFAVFDTSSRPNFISDLNGISFAPFDGSRSRDLLSTVGPACSKIRKAINQWGTRCDDRKLLVLFANPSDSHRIRCDVEMRAISSALSAGQRSGNIEIVSEWAVRASELDQILYQHRPDMLHIACSTSGNDLLFEDNSGRSQPLTPEGVRAFIRPITNALQCIIFSACNTEGIAESLACDVECSIGIPGIISDEATISFTSGFYTAIGNESDYLSAYNSAVVKMQINGSEFHPPIMYSDGKQVNRPISNALKKDKVTKKSTRCETDIREIIKLKKAQQAKEKQR
jgi:hypothetical protein